MTLDFAYDATYKRPEKKKTENNDEALVKHLSDRLAIELGNSKTYDPKILAQQVATCFDPLALDETSPLVKIGGRYVSRRWLVDNFTLLCYQDKNAGYFYYHGWPIDLSRWLVVLSENAFSTSELETRSIKRTTDGKDCAMASRRAKVHYEKTRRDTKRKRCKNCDDDDDTTLTCKGSSVKSSGTAEKLCPRNIWKYTNHENYIFRFGDGEKKVFNQFLPTFTGVFLNTYFACSSPQPPAS
jgi:hypothetical protein